MTDMDLTQKLKKPDYEKQVADTRDTRMAWWRQARYGLFIHYGLYSQVGRHEWMMKLENWPIPEYEKLADTFSPRPGIAREWAALAKKAGMKYMVLTARHCDGYSLWDSATNPYNSVRRGPGRDLVAEFVAACREFGLKIGLYLVLMEWHHPDCDRCAWDSDARRRYNDHITGMVRELMTQYGKIDLLWYDCPLPMESWEGWDSLERNQMVRGLQPEIIINNRSRLDEDYSTPEGHITPADGDWESCMTSNQLAWGHIDPAQAARFTRRAPEIIHMLNTVTAGGGNLLLNIGPHGDGSIPEDVVEPFETAGRWLAENGEAVYGLKDRILLRCTSGVCGVSLDQAKKRAYIWHWIWPKGGETYIGGFITPVRKAWTLNTGNPVAFDLLDRRIRLKGLPDACPDPHAGLAVTVLEFDTDGWIEHTMLKPSARAKTGKPADLGDLK